MIKNIPDYTPQSIADVIFPCDDSEDFITGIIDGSIPFPISGKNGIILNGVNGTGKTALAKLLPDAIERCRTGNDSNYTFEYVQIGNKGAQLFEKLINIASVIPFASHHYFVLDEVDNLLKEAMTSLKTVMNMPNTIFIMTTNNITKIEKGVLNRSHRIDFNAAPTEKWLKLFKKVMHERGVIPPDDSILIPVIEKCNGSVREIVSAALQLARKINQAQKNTYISVTSIPTGTIIT
jgi:DNA polymerase III gamma/tau subunit